MKTTPLVAILLLGLAVCASAGRRDPLNAKEADEVREVAQEPDKRLPLMVKFARVRVETIERLRSDPRFGAERGPQIRTLLEDLTAMVDELGDNIDDYAQRHADLRKPLKATVEGLTEFQVKLRSVKESKSDPAFAAETKDYEFALENAIDAVNAGLDNARKTLQEQEALAREKKLNKGEKK